MANNISKDILEPENGTETTSATDVVTPNPVVSETQPVAPPDLAIPLPQEVLAWPEAERRRKQLESLAMTGPKPEKPKGNWLKIAGKYSEDSVVARALDAALKIREDERDANT